MTGEKQTRKVEMKTWKNRSREVSSHPSSIFSPKKRKAYTVDTICESLSKPCDRT